ncbi:MAG: MMPL family transporter [Actinomycetota bacterium]|nr:MMPL family transporter [Actinomycetota bacterium]
MLGRLADLACSHPRRVAIIGLVLFIVVGVLGGPAPGAFNAPNAFNDPGSQSTHAEQGIERATGAAASADVIALVHAPRSGGEVARIAGILRADPGIARVAVPPPTPSGPSPAVSRDGRQVLVAATLRTGAGDDDVVKRLESAFASDRAVALGGSAVAGHQVGSQATGDLAIAEGIAFPLLAILSLIVFRGVAALLPVAIGGLSVLTAFAVLRAINSVLALSPFALNLVIGAGLGLGVDYSLFLVSRFREELGCGADVPGAVRTTMRTAGRTVLFSGVTVAAAMACLTVFPQRFLISMGLGGLVVALVAAASSVVFLPALFMLMGRRLGKVKPGPEGTGRWYRLARAVMRRPGVVAALTPSLSWRWPHRRSGSAGAESTPRCCRPARARARSRTRSRGASPARTPRPRSSP